MSGEGFTRREISAFLVFAVSAVLIGVGAYQLGYNLSGGRGGATVQPPAQTKVVNGQALYASNCAACHGAKAEGGVGPALAQSASWSSSEFKQAVLLGKTSSRELGAVMPRFGQTGLDGSPATDEQIRAIQEHLSSLK